MARKNPLSQEAEASACDALEASLRALEPDRSKYHPAALGRLLYHVVQIAEGDRHQQKQSIDALRKWIEAGFTANDAKKMEEDDGNG